MRITTAALLIVMAVAGAGAQDAGQAKPEPGSELLPVGDIVRSAPPRPVPRPVSILPDAFQRSSAGPGGLGNPDEPEPGAQPLVQEGDLRDAVEFLLGGRVLRLWGVSGDRFQVPAVEAAAARGALDRLRGLRPRAITLGYTFEVSEAGGWQVLLSGEEPILPGVRAVFADAEDSTFLCDYEVELAQDSQLPDPIVATRRTGASLDLRISPLPGGRAAVVEAVVRGSDLLPMEEAEPRYQGMGVLDRGALRGCQAALMFRAEPGRETVHAWTGRDGRCYRLRMTPSWTVPKDDRGPVAALWSPVFDLAPAHRRHTGFHLAPAGAEADETSARFGMAEERWRPAPEDYLERIRSLLPEEMGFTQERSGGSLLLLGGPGAGTAARALEGVMDREFTNAVVEVEARQAGEEGRILFAASGPLSPDIDVNFLSGEARNYIEDWDVEVAQGSWIPDPIMDCLQTGDFLNLRILEGGDAGPNAVDVDLQMALLKGFEMQDLPILDAMDRTGGSPSGTAVGSPKWTTFRIEMPTVREVRIAGRYPLGEDGTVTIRRSAAGFLGAGKEIVLTVKVRKP